MICDARIRPFPDPDYEIKCERDNDHTEHSGVIHDYAHEGSETALTWLDDDRRNFHGDYPGICSTDNECVLPDGHPREHAQ